MSRKLIPQTFTTGLEASTRGWVQSTCHHTDNDFMNQNGQLLFMCQDVVCKIACWELKVGFKLPIRVGGLRLICRKNTQEWYSMSRIPEFGNSHPVFPNYTNICRTTPTCDLSAIVPVSFAGVKGKIETISVHMRRTLVICQLGK